MTERNDSQETLVAAPEPQGEGAAAEADGGPVGDRLEEAHAEAAAVVAETTEPVAADAAPPGVESLISVAGLVKHYGPIRAVDGISFEVRRGDILGFLGPNGAGKTTAMRLLTGFLEPDAGEIRIGGHDLATDSLAVRQTIGYLPENAPAYGEMTVHGFLEFIAEARAVADPPAAIDRVIEMTGLKRVVYQTIETLSKGYKRRVGLAQALIHDPEVLILDEPTDGLDPNQKALVMELISNLSHDKCIILSTHILDEVERICNRAMIISQGKILVDSTPEKLIAQAPNHNVIRLELHDENPGLFDRIAAEPWCDRLLSQGPTRADVYPVGGANHLADLLAVVKDEPVQSVHLQEGRLTELFRKVTEGIAT
jgi:ABC-2 type transport system ATP-binding protein